jgi:hypothetical protein
MRLLPVCLVAVSVGCGGGGPAPVGPTTASAELRRESDNPNPVLFPKEARPYGRSIERWSELLWSYIYAQPVDHNPFFDTTGADCAVGQGGPVWFLPAVPGSSLGTEITRSCTIPHQRAVMLQLSSALNDYPCPDPTFQPAPGQSLYDFLIGGISPLFDGVTGFEITLDGVAIQDPLSYRFSSDDLFFFKGDLSMQAFDNCVTGKRQPAVSDGFYLMFKPLSPGEHTIVINGHDMHGVPVTLTDNLTIR